MLNQQRKVRASSPHFTVSCASEASDRGKLTSILADLWQVHCRAGFVCTRRRLMFLRACVPFNCNYRVSCQPGGRPQQVV